MQVNEAVFDVQTLFYFRYVGESDYLYILQATFKKVVYLQHIICEVI